MLTAVMVSILVATLLVTVWALVARLWFRVPERTIIKVWLAAVLIGVAAHIPAYLHTRSGPDYKDVHAVKPAQQTREVREIIDISRKPELTPEQRAARLDELSDWKSRSEEK